MELIHLNFAGPVVRLQVNGRRHTFEMHRYCGPMKLKADGETPAKNFWSENSDFWPVFDDWVRQGQRVDEHGCGMVD
jgi:hypothetical protein